MIVPFVLVTFGPESLPFPKAWLGSWEGSAEYRGRTPERLRLQFSANGEIVLDETTFRFGKSWRRIYRGNVQRERAALMFNDLGVKGTNDGESVAIGEDGQWYFRGIRLAASTLSRSVQGDPQAKDDARLHFQLRRARSSAPFVLLHLAASHRQ